MLRKISDLNLLPAKVFIAFFIRREMFGGIDPKKMQAMMKQMGIKQDELEVERVVFECIGKRVVVEPANVVKIVMQGQESWQVTGEAREEAREAGISDADVMMVAEKAGVSKEDARKALEESNGDIAEAIMALSE